MNSTLTHITKEMQIELCKEYNNSDIGALLWMQPYCNLEMIAILDRCLELNEMLNDDCLSGEETDEYYEKKWILLSAFGLECDLGDAKVDGVFYQ